MLKNFLRFFLPFALLVVVGGVFTYSDELNREVERLKVEGWVRLNIGASSLQRDLTEVAHDVRGLAHLSSLEEAIERPDAERLDRLAHDLVAFGGNKGIYDQLRWLDERGAEVVRVQYRDGKVYRVPEEELQAKGDRYYFQRTMSVGAGELYISPFDLNVEFDEVEAPFKPMIRVGTPLFGRDGHPRGILLLNYRGQVLLDRFAAQLPDGVGEIALLNQDGYWLYSAESGVAWGFMLGLKDQTYGHRYPAAWEQITRGEQGELRELGGLFLFRTVHPILDTPLPDGSTKANTPESGYQWKLVVRLSPSEMALSGRHAMVKIGISAVALLGIGVMGSILYTLVWRRHERSLTELHRELERANSDLRESNRRLQQANIDLHHSLEETETKSRALDAARESGKRQEQLLIQQSKMAAMGEMIGAIAHQWRQPLTAVGGALLNIKDAFEFDELGRDYLQRQLDTAQRHLAFMSRTIDDFRNFFAPAKEKSPFCVVRATLNALAMVQPQLRDHELYIELRIASGGRIQALTDFAEERWDGPALSVVGYRNEFIQVVINLVANAKDAIQARIAAGELEHGRGRVSVLTAESGGHAIIAVEDNGGGVAEEVLERVFEPYFTTKEEGQGTGIGLYMSKMIIEENMGGALSAENREGGAVFTIRLASGG